MPQFILLDHSLKGIGGHHFDYAVHVVKAAHELGFQTVVASHQRFRGHSFLPANCRVFPLFRYHTYSRYTLFSGDRYRLIDPPRKPPEQGDGTARWSLANLGAYLRTQWREFKELRHRGGPQRRMRDLSRNCARLFKQVPLKAGDQVFVPTLSELDLLGLVQYLEQAPESQCADWHFQFHFNFLDGREPDYADQQSRSEQMRKLFAGALERAPHHRLHCYNTSHELTRQFNRLGVTNFTNLAYPINPAFYTARSGRVAEGALRVTCAGGVREEKGQGSLSGLVESLWADYLAPGKMQLVVQSGKERYSNQPKFQLPLPTPAKNAPRVRLPREACDDPVVYIRHPLGLADYADFVSRADIGLLLYDSRRYYTRRAGVMGELLTAGVPVIVPAGCWLAEQLAEPIYQHQLKLESTLPLVGRLAASELAWQQPAATLPRVALGDEVSCGDKSAPAETLLDVPPGTRELLVSFTWATPAEPGVYLKLRAESLDAAGRVVGEFRTIVGQRASGEPVPALFHVSHNVTQVKLTCCNAYHHAMISLRDFRVSWLGSTGELEHAPAGAVGLIAADAEQAPALLRDMCDHYAHYRRSAEEFSHGWYQAHAPTRTVGQLCSTATQRRELTRAA